MRKHSKKEKESNIALLFYNSSFVAMILSLETSGKSCSVALSAEGKTLTYRNATDTWRHSQVITTLIQQSLEEIDADLNDLKAVAVSQGPGSYTGLRVGTSCAKGLCYALDIPLLSVPTLELIAFPFIEKVANGGKIVPFIDARRMEVYYNIYDYSLKEAIQTTNLVLETDSFEAFTDDKLIFCGDGAHEDLAYYVPFYLKPPNITKSKKPLF